MTYEEAEEYLLNIPKFTKKNEPEKTKAFLNELTDFSLSIPTIHVAGTNGKGSVCAYLRAGLSENGLRVGLFTSPHLVSMRERFVIGDEMISEREFVNVFLYVKESLSAMKEKDGFRSYHPTFFEYLFFMAAVWFMNKKPDVIILETGLGGRLDATNSISSPKVSVITEIGLDHCEYLGDTKDLIAGEKAGIIKEGVPIVHVSHGESWDEVINRKASEKGSENHIVSNENIKNLETNPSGIDFLFHSLYDDFVKISLKTEALYQVENAALAYRTLEVLSNLVPNSFDLEKAVEGFKNMKWPGRMEHLKSGLIIDGAHNEDGISAFLRTVSNDGAKHRRLLYGAVSDKNIEAVASLIIGSGLFEEIYVTKLASYRSSDLDRLKKAFSECKDIKVLYYNSVCDGYSAILSGKESSVKAYAAGSLYLVGELKAMGEEEND